MNVFIIEVEQYKVVLTEVNYLFGRPINVYLGEQYIHTHTHYTYTEIQQDSLLSRSNVPLPD